MKRIVSAPGSRTARRLLASGALLGVLLAAGAAAIGDVSPEAKRSRGATSGSFSLFASPTLKLDANQWDCGLNSVGEVCTDVFNSPTGGGGFWPGGTANAYIFNTGMQVVGISADGDYEWANDTLGAFFFDATGNRRSGDAWTNIYNSLDPTDLCGPTEKRTIFIADPDPEALPGSTVPLEIDYDPCWGQADFDANQAFPTLEDLYITSADVYQENLLGRASVSQQDSWVQYWDGNPAFIEQRQHPMGILITQRSLAWNYPLGNESIIYFIYSIQNVTDTYDFQSRNELAFFGGADGIPGNPTPGPDGRDGGITFNEVYAGFSTDMDVTSDASANFSTAILPFDLGISYHGGFDAPDFVYPPSLFYSPFFTSAPGIVGVKYLRSPVNPATGEEVGLTRFSITLNGGPPGSVDDPQNDKQLWRYHSGFLNSALGDAPCSIDPEVDTGLPSTSEQSVCFVYQSPFDTRFFQSSGPFTLAPGQEVTVVVAYLAAATVATMPDQTPSGIIANAATNANPPGTPSFHPGFPSARGCDANGENCSVVDAANPVKALERGAGWVSYNGPAPSGRAGGALEGPENKLPLFDENGTPYIEVVPNSLLGKALVAQTIFNSKFLLGFAPAQPVLYLVPGDNQVTVIWEPSTTEEDGDPFFEVAGDPTSPLYNPNYRRNDVEAYAIWRSSGTSEPEIVAFFDYADTQFFDYTCETIQPDEDLHDWTAAVPEGTIGFAAGEECPLVAPGVDPENPDGIGKNQGINTNLFFNNGIAGGGAGGGVVRLADSSALGSALTQVGVDEWPYPPLGDTGVPFTFIDPDAVNNFQYRYAVQAIDVNSYASGPYSLSSARAETPTTPRQDNQNVTFGELEVFLSGAAGTALPTGPVPSIDPDKGVFSGPFPPTDGGELSFLPFVQRLLGDFEVKTRIDSAVPVASPGSSFGTPTDLCANGGDPFSSCVKYYLTQTTDEGDVYEEVLDVYHPWWNSFGEAVPQVFTLTQENVPFDSTALADFGIPSGAADALLVGSFNEALNNSAAESAQNRRSGSSTTSRVRHGGSRWFSGENETIADPAVNMSVGMVEGVDTVWAPISYTPREPGDEYDLSTTGASFEKQCFNRGIAKMGRAADVEFRWDGGLEVWDVTHDVPVMFKPTVQASYGFLTTDANGNGFIDWQDFNYIDGALQILRNVGGGNCDAAAGTSWDPNAEYTPVQLTDTPTIVPTSIDGIYDIGIDGLEATGQGFGLYINGERYIFETSAVPTSGTWTLRTYSGTVRSDAATFNTGDPAGYEYRNDYTGATTGQRPLPVPGLTFNWRATTASSVVATYDLRNVHTVPDPYLATSQYDQAPTSKFLQFVNLPPEATIRIYTLTGVLVNELVHNDATGGGRETWNLRNWSNQFVASGVYFFHVITPEGDERVGKFTIVNFAGQN